MFESVDKGRVYRIQDINGNVIAYVIGLSTAFKITDGYKKTSACLQTYVVTIG